MVSPGGAYADAVLRAREEAARHNRESTGLGLAIVKHIARTHKVRLRVQSAPGRGTTFTLNFASAENQNNTQGLKKEETRDGIPADS